jgi:prepilin-type N-terminal cleavage/methylation domain-containing protein
MNARGWTLVEMLVVMSVLAVLLAVAVPYYRNVRRRALHAQVVDCARGLLLKEHVFFVDSGRYAAPEDLVHTGLTPSCVLSCDRMDLGAGRVICWKGRVRWVLERVGSTPLAQGVGLRVWRTGSPYAAVAHIDATGEWVDPEQPFP